MSLITDRYVMTAVCDMVTAEIVKTVKDDLEDNEIFQPSVVSEIIMQQLDSLEAGKRATVYLVLGVHTRRDKVIPAGAVTNSWIAHLKSGLGRRNPIVYSQDYALTIALWEWSGSLISEYGKVLWTSGSRMANLILRAGADNDLILMESGKVMEGMTTPASLAKSAPWKDKISDWLAVIKSMYSPDLVFVSPILDGEGGVVNDWKLDALKTVVTAHKNVALIPNIGLYRDALDWTFAGVILAAQKDILGDTPSFMRESPQDAGLEEIDNGIIEYSS